VHMLVGSMATTGGRDRSETSPRRRCHSVSSRLCQRLGVAWVRRGSPYLRPRRAVRLTSAHFAPANRRRRPPGPPVWLSRLWFMAPRLTIPGSRPNGMTRALSTCRARFQRRTPYPPGPPSPCRPFLEDGGRRTRHNYYNPGELSTQRRLATVGIFAGGRTRALIRGPLYSSRGRSSGSDCRKGPCSGN
jgi:hypothetical protein